MLEEDPVRHAAETMSEFWLLGFYALLVIGLMALILGLSQVLGQRCTSKSKATPFESGVLPVGTARLRFPAHFYLVALFFVIFDLEAAYLFAWAIAVREAGWIGYVEALIFIVILLAALVYLWRLGALDWAPRRRDKAQAQENRRKADALVAEQTGR